MSRAFTREIDDAPIPPASDRPISAAPNLVTPEGAGKITTRLDEIDRAIQAGSEPGALDELLREQRYWSARRATMQVMPTPHNPEVIGFGVTATIVRRGRPSTVRIVGEDEAEPRKGLLAWTSPLAQTLEGAETGEVVVFEAGGRSEEIEVLNIR